jgi:hypothetical protein
MEEIWKDIIGYEGYYQVSNLGRVKRLKGSPMTLEDRVLVNKTKKTGYKFVCLSVCGGFKYKHVHRLVAQAFIPNPNNKLFVNHIDCDKSNNHVENLEWVTAKENSKHARENVVFNYNPPTGLDNPLCKQVAQKNLQGDFIYLWDSLRSISNFYDVAETAIGKACLKSLISIGFMWEYIEKDYYLLNKNNFTEPPQPIVLDKRKRDLTIAQKAKNLKNNAITKEELLQIGIDCYNEYGNIYRASLEEFARNNGKKSYGFIVKRFGTFKNFQSLVKENISK